MHVGEPGPSILERCVVLVPFTHHVGVTRGSQKNQSYLGLLCLSYWRVDGDGGRFVPTKELIQADVL